MGGYVTALKEHSREIAKLEGAQADEFLRLLSSLRDELQGRLSRLGPSDSVFDAYRFRQVIAESEVGINALERKARGQWDKASETATDLAVEHIEQELEALGSAFDKAPEVISIDAAQILADPMQGLLANHFDTSVRRYGLDLLNGVRQKLFTGMRAGDSLEEVVKSVASDRGPFGEIGQANATRLIRTETSQVYGAAQQAGLKEAKKEIPDLQKTWIHIGSYDCPICAELHGKPRP